MNGFRYKHGDRPLEGYTIQRAVGRGGFGEVYYAVSDSGREVALKAVQGYEQIELRGVSQCMNLKSPHLVTIFDVKHNAEGTPFVIMEYVAGPSLRELLTDAPSGLGVQKAAFFLREIGKGLTFLHDRGIVHRDLKPGNIFYEDGYVKIGDYGLSKAITPSQHSGQTVTVGTVHYMAPEIGKGSYDRGIDVYALGVLLYEMLTGQVPFFGASHGEVLMKHLMAEPDLSGIEEPFATVIKKAMAKEPTDRYESVQQMVEAVFGAEHIQQSVSHFRPESLSMVAERVAQKVTVGGTGSSAEHAPRLGPPPLPALEGKTWGQWGQEMGDWGQRFGEHITEVGTRIGQRFHRRVDAPQTRKDEVLENARALAASDPLNRRQRFGLWLLTAVAMAGGTGFLSAPHEKDTVVVVLFVGAMILGASKFVALVGYRYLSRLQQEAGLVRYLAFGGAALAGALILGGLFIVDDGLIQEESGRSLLPVLIGLFLIDWAARVPPEREERISLSRAFTAGLLGLVLALILGANVVLVIGTLAGVSMAVEAISPFAPGAGKRLAAAERERRCEPRRQAKQSPPQVPGLPYSPATPPRAQAGAHRAGALLHAASPQPRRVPAVARILAFVLLVPSLAVGVLLLLWAAMNGPRDDEFPLAMAVAPTLLGLAAFCLAVATRSGPRRWWGLIRPLLLLVCVATALVSVICLGTFPLRGDPLMAVVFFIVFPAVAFVVIACVTNRTMENIFGDGRRPAPVPVPPQAISPKRRSWALLLAISCVLPFPCVCGLQRFYVGKIGTGILWLFTGGLLGIGQLIDVILIASGGFTDKQGRRLVVWDSEDELKQPKFTANERGEIAAVSSVADAAAAPYVGTVGQDGPVTPREPDGGPPGPPPPAPASVYPRLPRHPLSILLSLLGGVLLLAAFVVGLFVAVGVPQIITAGLAPYPNLAEELNREFGYPGWPKLANEIAISLAAVLVLTGVVGLIIARRRAGGAHQLRAVLGAGGLVAVLSALNASLERVNWYMIAKQVEDHQTGPALESFLDAVQHAGMAFTAVLLVLSIVLFAWPPRRRQRDVFHDGYEEAER